MSEAIRNSCPSTATRSHLALAALTLALAFAPAAQSQTSGTVRTLGGTGEQGYSEGVQGSSQFANASALALRGNGFLFIADTDNDRVRLMDLSSTRTELFALGNRPVGLAVDSKTNLYVANQGDGTIVKYDYFKNPRQTNRPPLTGPITALAIDRLNNLYIAQLNGVISRLNTNGFIDRNFQAPAPGVLRGVAVTDSGTLYASDAAGHVIWRFDTNGVPEVYAGTLNQSGLEQGELGFGRFNSPHQIAVGPNGSIVVADRGNHQVRVVSCDRVVTVLWGVPSSAWWDSGALGNYPGWYELTTIEYVEAREPVGIAADKLGAVYDTEIYYDLVRVGTGLSFPAACSGSSSQQPTNTPPVVVLDPSSGYFPTGITITLTASNAPAGFTRDIRLFYTLTGISPTLQDTEVAISDDGKARFFLDGPVDLAKLRVRAFIGENGGVVTAASPTQVPKPVLSPNSGYYPMGVDIVVTSTNGFPAGTELRYTTDGSDPSTNSTLIPHDGNRAVIGWRLSDKDLRSLRVKAFLGPNEGTVAGGRAVSFPGEPQYQGEVGIPPARNGFRAGIGSYYILPIVANLRDDQSLRSLNCMVELTRLPGSPVLGKDDIQVITMSSNDFIKVLPASTRTPQVTRTAANGTNRVLISYVGPETGFEVDHGFATVALLGIQFRAEDGQGNVAQIGGGYNIRIYNISGASDGFQEELPLKPMSQRTIRFENIQFREGDTSPAYWYNAGDFGDNALGVGDVSNAIYASLGFGRPFLLTDAFAAMDVYRLGVLENVVEYLDSATILRRYAGFESSDIFRIRNEFGEWDSTRTSATPLVRNSVRSLATNPRVWNRDVTIVGGVIDQVTGIQSVAVPVYLKAGVGVSVSGLQFVADVQPAANGVTFEPSSALPAPNWSGSNVPDVGDMPSTVYARWDNLPTPLTGTVLLGHIRFATPAVMAAGQPILVNFRETGGAAIDPISGELTPYFFESIHGEVWPWSAHPETARVSDDWKVHFFGTSSLGVAHPDDDADNDGFSNLEEYIAGSDPTRTDWHVKVDNGHLSFRWVGRFGKTYSVEKTQDFKTWNSITGRIAGQDGFQEYNELSSSARAQFYRLNVQ